jgi:TatD DNase family protein
MRLDYAQNKLYDQIRSPNNYFAIIKLSLILSTKTLYMNKLSFIDSHAHINLLVKNDFDRPLSNQELQDAKILLAEFADNNLHVINVGTSLTESINCVEISNLAPNIAKAAVGIHPNDIGNNWSNDLEHIEKLIIDNKNNNQIVAIGECGYDKHYPNYDIQLQKDCFEEQIKLALKYNKALIIHTRNAKNETLTTLEKYKDQVKKLVIHCFSEDEEFAGLIISWGYYLGIGGTLTYPKNELLRKIVKTHGINQIILETDSPYLAPQILRGKVNTPQNIPIIAKYMADLLEIEIEDVAKTTSLNCKNLFNF